MERAKFKIAEIHSDLEQAQREDVLNGFTSGRIPILVATDILSRGIDIDTIDLVINYDVPRDAEDYVHRIGRTARAEADGMAFTLVSPVEQNKFAVIEKLIGKEVEKQRCRRSLALPLNTNHNYAPGTKAAAGGRRHYHKRPNNNGRPRGKLIVNVLM